MKINYLILLGIFVLVVIIIFFYKYYYSSKVNDTQEYLDNFGELADSIKVYLYQAEWCEFCSAFGPEWEYTIYQVNNDQSDQSRIAFQTLEVSTSGNVATPILNAPIERIPTVIIVGYKGNFEEPFFEKEFKPDLNVRLIDFIYNNIKKCKDS